jgi:hypothetical protein
MISCPISIVGKAAHQEAQRLSKAAAMPMPDS